MNDQLFHGYNCFATAVGQHLINIKKYKAKIMLEENAGENGRKKRK